MAGARARSCVCACACTCAVCECVCVCELWGGVSLGRPNAERGEGLHPPLHPPHQPSSPFHVSSCFEPQAVPRPPIADWVHAVPRPPIADWVHAAMLGLQAQRLPLFPLTLTPIEGVSGSRLDIECTLERYCIMRCCTYCLCALQNSNMKDSTALHIAR